MSNAPRMDDSASSRSLFVSIRSGSGVGAVGFTLSQQARERERGKGGVSQTLATAPALLLSAENSNRVTSNITC